MQHREPYPPSFATLTSYTTHYQRPGEIRPVAHDKHILGMHDMRLAMGAIEGCGKTLLLDVQSR